MNIIPVIACLIIIVILVKFIDNIKNKRRYQLLQQFPSHTTYPLIGNAHLMLGSVDGFLAKIEKLLQPFDRLVYWIGPIPILCLKKHEDIAMVLNRSSDRETLGISHQWAGIGLLNAKYEEWKKSRKIFAPAFSSDPLSKYLQVFNKNALKLVEKLKSVADTDEQVDISHWITSSSMESILENSIGVQIQKGGKLEEDFCKALNELMRETVKQLQWPFLLIPAVYTIYLKITGKIKLISQFHRLPAQIIKDTLNTAHDDEDPSKTMLNLLIKKGLGDSGFTETRLRDELLQIMAAATDTLAQVLSFLTLMLAIHQDIQEKVYEEITQLTADDHILTENHMTNGLTYLEQCIKETMRMFSPGIAVSRRNHKEIMLNDNTIIPANTIIVGFVHLVNQDTNLYKNPLKWDPEHFSEQAVNERPKTSQLIFGYGPRSCIAYKYALMSIKTQITHILRNYHLSTNIKEFTGENLKADLSIRSKIGYPVKLTTRREIKPMAKEE